MRDDDDIWERAMQGPAVLSFTIADGPPLSAYEDDLDLVPDDEIVVPEAAAIEPLPGAVDPSDWSGRNAPERRFIIPGWLVRGHAGLLSGMEGVGKSLIAQQMLTCAAIGRPFLGLPIEHVNTIYITCEDSQDELWRRQESINRSLGITMDDIAGKMLLVSLCGELGNELGTFDREGRITPSPRFRQIEATCSDFNAGLIVLDNAAHLFPGNEIVRHEVAAFLGLLERLSQKIDGAVLLLAHPNKQHSQGNKQGNEYSGSTGWSAHVRNRLFLDYREEGDDGVPVDGDERVLRKSKANYGKRGEEITFRWHEWAFVIPEDLPDGVGAEIAAIAQANAENELFLACLDKATAEKRATSASASASSYAPRLFSKMPLAKGTKMAAFEAAMNRLLSLGVIGNDERVYQRSNRTWAFGIARIEGASGCTNPAQTLNRTNPAQTRTNHLNSLHNSAHAGGAQTPAQTPAQTMHKPAQSSSTQVHTSSPSPYRGNPGGVSPQGDFLPDFPADEPPAWMDDRPPLSDDEWRSDIDWSEDQ